MTPDLEVSREVAASPEVVFAAITDITRMGEWSPECVQAEWAEGFSKAEVGARFIGHNKNGDKTWTIESTIFEFVENERFFFECMSGRVPGFVFAKWGYSIEPTQSGCTITEYWQDLRADYMLEPSAQISGVADRVSHNRAGMEATLNRLGAAVEGA